MRKTNRIKDRDEKKTTLSLLFPFRGAFCDLGTGDPQVGIFRYCMKFRSLHSAHDHKPRLFTGDYLLAPLQ